MSKILITGSKGQLGRALKKMLSDMYDLTLFDIDNLDITNIDQVYAVIGEVKPDIIINAAAYTAVDLCEENKVLAHQVNAIGPKNLATIANQVGSKLVHISTDYIFDGKGIKLEDDSIRPYIETDEPNPQNVYGQSKLDGEKYITSIIDNYYIIRTAWLYGQGKNFLDTMLELAKKHDTIKVVNDQLGSPTSTYELSLMIKAIIQEDDYGIYHGTCEGQCSWYTFAKEIFKLKHIDIDVIPVNSDEFPRPAKRPNYSVLENRKLYDNRLFQFKEWENALSNYLNQGELR